MKVAGRVGAVPPYPFVEISRKIAAKKAQGIDVISFGIGDPDIPTPPSVLEALHKASLDTPNHRYPESEGLPEFRGAVADWYKRRFDVTLDPETEVVSLIGAKEGIGHAAMAFVEPGDIALVPDPGYPVYSVGTLFAGGESYIMPLMEGNRWWPDLDAIPEDVAAKATIMWLNYPNNPTGATAELGQFAKAIEFASLHDMVLMHDACYSEVTYDGYRPRSLLQVEGARDIGVEFHSLSKSYNMTGWRLGMAVGNPEVIEALRVIKSNIDSGVPQAIQQMGIAAMETPDGELADRNEIYQRRRDLVVGTLRALGLTVQHPRASLYVWAGVPDGFTSAGFSERLLEETDVLVSPGTSYGKWGEGYVRLSLTLADDQLEKAVDRMSTWSLPAPK